MPSRPSRILVWFRRDLRSQDHAALAAALGEGAQVWCAFVFDRDILDALPSRADRRVEFIHDSLAELDATLRANGGGLIVRHGRACDEIPRLAATLGVGAVYANRDYEPAAVARDAAVAQALRADGRDWRDFKDQVVFERGEVLTGAGTPFSVFTPYKAAWMKRLADADLAERATGLQGPAPGAPAAERNARAAQSAPGAERPAAGRLAPPPPGHELPALESLGFERTNLRTHGIPTGESGAQRLFDEFSDRIGAYREARDYPAVRGPSYLSVHLRFGTVSVRGLARFALQAMRADPAASEGAATWLSELIWREFYFQVLHHHPRVAEGAAFRPEYDRIAWETGEHADRLFAAWCAGATGYPLVDAAMLQLAHSGYMHNRLRMVTASFLAKDLGVDWRRGEAWFAAHLNDFDLAANNGGWQWAASTGCDAQPWFRIFNPVTQSRRFDPEGRFIRRYLPQLSELPDKHIHAPWLAPAAVLQQAGLRLGTHYPRPVVDHDVARKATLARYGVLKGEG
ncbi:cryptochrome/photolyase family protein [Quisquiliibacterium transsilvanicum]|uniref:Deoxyribodipyrimidine photo-lyase n=1 Tax=Quisquiliibacterium transsilvanicum TaxID=1549638 RepID=A0A7W8HLT8_9BURK|nr:deoxyribodipyrimidine photo-lyase [Quisquiliibacterium transsilvanicum]MBB5273473.1 deoxyribodipyrimidine photo-lyase [Quisquiliibacterium transsilvanicum]